MGPYPPQNEVLAGVHPDACLLHLTLVCYNLGPHGHSSTPWRVVKQQQNKLGLVALIHIHLNL